MGPKPSVILIREWEGQLTGSGCCGRLEGDFPGCPEEPVFPERRRIMEEMGPLYRGLRQRYGDRIDLQVVDPRGAGLIFLLLRDFFAFRVGIREALRTLARLPVQAVVVNGRLLARSRWPSLEEVAARTDAPRRERRATARP